ncbi:MAG: hypothetical protein Q8O99_05205 [bacterium]|nr:hypothetical protein [bacterium]
MLLSHAELFQLIWVKLFEHAKLFEEKQAKAKELIRQEEKQKNEKAKEEEAKLKDALKFKPLKNIWHKIENL